MLHMFMSRVILSEKQHKECPGCDALSSAPVPPSFSPSSFSGRTRDKEIREEHYLLLLVWKIPTQTKTDRAYNWEKSVLCFRCHTHSVVCLCVSSSLCCCLFRGSGLLAFDLLQSLALLLFLFELPLQSQNCLILSHCLLKTQPGFPLFFPARCQQYWECVCVCVWYGCVCVCIFA